MKATFQSYAGSYLLGINLQDWYPCWNFTLSGRLVAANFLPLVDPSFSAQRRIEDITLEELAENPHCFSGTMTPRALWYVWAASIIRAGGHVGIGKLDTKWLPEVERERIRNLGDIELEIEKLRREIAPNATSRLGCLWVADNTPQGAANIRDMLGPAVYLSRVSIPVAANVSKADRKWFDLYCHERKSEYISNYWRSIPFSSTDFWEYLVDEVVESEDRSDIEYIKSHGARMY